MTMENYLLQLVFPNEAMKYQKLTIRFTFHLNHNIRSARNDFRCFHTFKSPCADIATHHSTYRYVHHLGTWRWLVLLC